VGEGLVRGNWKRNAAVKSCGEAEKNKGTEGSEKRKRTVLASRFSGCRGKKNLKEVQTWILYQGGAARWKSGERTPKPRKKESRKTSLLVEKNSFRVRQNRVRIGRAERLP